MYKPGAYTWYIFTWTEYNPNRLISFVVVAAAVAVERQLLFRQLPFAFLA
jgi:hypothetical protein